MQFARDLDQRQFGHLAALGNPQQAVSNLDQGPRGRPSRRSAISAASTREKYPRILFIWGLTRILPVTIDSMTIAELEYDALLNPLRAEVDISLSVIAIDQCSDDDLARGALDYTTIAKEAQAIANLANTAEQIVDLIPL